MRTTAMFAGYARSTRSLAINMDVTDGRRLFGELAQRADVVIENLGPGQMERWGFDAQSLLQRNPGLVIISISGYGRTGPRAHYRAYASNINNYLGLTRAWAYDGMHFDYVAGYHAANAIVAALGRARQIGQGAYIDLAQAEAGASVMAPLYLDALNNGPPWDYAQNEVPGSLLSVVVRCRGEDRWAALEIEDLDDWVALCHVMERPDLIVEREADADGQRRNELVAALEKWGANETPYQLAVKLQRAGLAAAPVTDSEDLWRDLQLRSRSAFVDVVHPDLGTLEYPQSPDRLTLTPGRVRSPGSRLGEHGEAVISEWLDMNQAEVATLRDSGAFWEFHSEQ